MTGSFVAPRAAHAVAPRARRTALVVAPRARRGVARELARRNAARALAAPALLLVLASCQRTTDEPARVLVHLLTRPANPEGVYLNEDLVFHFSGEVDRTSVTRDSVRIATKD